ncbi:MAG: hypothetical protein ACYTGQ_03150, partial [Planctomycetota bacterium]
MLESSRQPARTWTRLCCALWLAASLGCERAEPGASTSETTAPIRAAAIYSDMAPESLHTVGRETVTRHVLAGAVIRPSDVVPVENLSGHAGKVTNAMKEAGFKDEYPRLIYLIEEGTPVKKGDLLFELESDVLHQIRYEREYQIDLAVLQVAQWTEALTTAKMQAEADQLDGETALN